MKGSKVAGRYAQALLELAQEQNKVDVVVDDMHFLTQATSEAHDFKVFLASPIINSNKKIGILEKVFEQFDELSMAFVRLITRNGRESLLPLIADQYGAKVKESRGIVPVSLSSAEVLNDEVKDEILSALEKQIEGKFEVKEIIDKDLIGGFVFRMGDTRIEASVARQFKELKQRLTR